MRYGDVAVSKAKAVDVDIGVGAGAVVAIDAVLQLNIALQADLMVQIQSLFEMDTQARECRTTAAKAFKTWIDVYLSGCVGVGLDLDVNAVASFVNRAFPPAICSSLPQHSGTVELAAQVWAQVNAAVSSQIVQLNLSSHLDLILSIDADLLVSIGIGATVAAKLIALLPVFASVAVIGELQCQAN